MVNISKEYNVDMMEKLVDGSYAIKYPKTQLGQVEGLVLPKDSKSFGSVSQWSDILIPNEIRGKALLKFLLDSEESNLEISSSEQAMLVIMEEERFDKDRQVPFDYEQIIYKLGQQTEVGQYLAWIEELLADHTRGVEKLELGLMLESGSLEISSSEYAMNIIMSGESAVGLPDYRVKFASESSLIEETIRLDGEIARLDNKIDGLA